MIHCAKCRTLSLVCSVVALSSALAGQVSPAVQTSFDKNEAQKAISNWKKDNHDLVRIQGNAKAKLTDTLTDKNKITTPKLSSPLVIPGEGEEDFLARAYLFELRDRKYAAMGTSAISDESKVKIKLEAADVAEFSFGDYLQQLGPLLKNPGALSVISKPRGALITIDDTPHGSTNRDFVVSRGKHSVSVKSPKLSCSGNVDVEAELVVFRCPT